VTGTLALLRDFYRDKLTSVVRHQANARIVGEYEANNTYQYVINREETELAWIAEAVDALGGTVDDVTAAPPSAAPVDAGAAMANDVREAQAFVDRWRGPLDGMVDARYARMLRVILGEALEQKRFFEQALAGRTDLLGRRSAAVGERVGRVLPTRWIE